MKPGVKPGVESVWSPCGAGCGSMELEPIWILGWIHVWIQVLIGCRLFCEIECGIE